VSTDDSTVQHGQPASGSRSVDSEELHAAFVRAGIAEAELPQPGSGDLVGRYTVLEHLGEGGMGVVYKAYDPQLDRNVALKLLRRVIVHDESGSELRLLREAQMLAKLQHPNVVAVFDTGLTNYGVFIAMELLHGSTLRGWLGKRRRGVGEILEVFRAAGRGLAAAHDAGFVHRDFKPSNVIVSEDGMVRVLDFGVASLVDLRVGELSDSSSFTRRAVARPPGTAEPLSSSDLRLTDRGCVVGTPPYMAPEQIAGERVDHRSDQFTFCVCLHLALYGHSPVIGEGLEERRFNMSQGRVLDERGMLTGSVGVSARVRRALRRGLSLQPEARFPTMHALLEELDEPPRRWPLVVAAATLVVGFAAGVVLDREVDPCVGSAAALEHEWGADAREAVRAAFAHSGHPQANELHERVAQQLDRYAAEWSEMHAASCRATLVARQQSEELHDQRLRCLERRRNRLRSTIDALGRIADPQQALHRTVLPFQIPRVADCADLEAVSAASPLPDAPALHPRVDALRRSIDEVETLKAAGDFPRGLELAQAVVEHARETGFAPVIAESLGSLGSLQAMAGSAREAQATLEASILEATKVGEDATAARSWTWLIYALVLQRQLELGRALEFAARAAVERADQDEVRGWLLNNLGALYGASAELERSCELLEQAIAFKERTLGRGHVDVGISWYNLGSAQIEQRRFAAARGALERARSIFEATVGRAHPLTFHAIGGLCRVEHESANYANAIDLCGRVLDHYLVSPTSAVIMGRNRFLMARALLAAGRVEEARAQARQALELAHEEDQGLAKEIEAWLADAAQFAPRDSAH
jgi:eukaryotic-like serine/threonine-protein kinase